MSTENASNPLISETPSVAQGDGKTAEPRVDHAIQILSALINDAKSIRWNFDEQQRDPEHAQWRTFAKKGLREIRNLLLALAQSEQSYARLLAKQIVASVSPGTAANKPEADSAWLCKVLAETEADIAKWPDWLRKAAGVCQRSPKTNL